MIPIFPLIHASSLSCNLRCRYCYYRYTSHDPRIMAEHVLNKLVKELIQQGGEVVHFCWHGGEPTLAGLDFFRHALNLQRHYQQEGRQVINSIQTNGILIDENWARFLADQDFQIGISLDGPQKFHDHYRRNQHGRGSFKQVMQAVHWLQSAGINPGVICVITDQNVGHPEEIIDFFVEQGIQRVNFSLAAAYNDQEQLELFSITSKQFGQFMIRLFEKWMSIDNPDLQIPRLQDYIRGATGKQTRSCEFNDWCRHYATFDYDGTVRVCCSLPQSWVIGNLTSQSLEEIFSSSNSLQINEKIAAARRLCNGCEWEKVCQGGCAGRSFLRGERRVTRNYFCSAHQKIYAYLKERLQA